MNQYIEAITDELTGLPVAGAEVFVYDDDNNLTTLFASDGTTEVDNPLITNENGEFSFYQSTTELTGVVYYGGRLRRRLRLLVGGGYSVAAAASAQAALAAAGVGEYGNTALGLADTAVGETFWVDAGNGTGIIYRHDAGPTATQIGKFIKDPTATGAATLFAGGVPTSAALANASGASLVGFVQAGTGATPRTALAKARDVVSIKDFGAVGGNAAADTAAINAAIDTGKHVFVPVGVYSYVPSGKALAFGQTIYGEGPLNTRIAKVDSNGDMFTMAAGSGLRDIGLQGNGGSLTGRGLVIGASTANITLQNVNILDMNGYAVEVAANNGGSQLNIIGGIYDRTDATLAAIKMPAGDTQASPRSLIGTKSTGVLIDTSGADNLFLTGIYTRDVFFGAASKKVMLVGSRISTIGGTLTVKGTDTVVAGNAVAGSIAIDSGAATCVVSSNVVVGASSNVDNSSIGANTTDFRYRGSKTYDPPSIPDGGADSTTVTCTGAKLGMFATASMSIDQVGVLVHAYVSATDTVTVRYQNESGGTADLGSHTLRVEAR